MHSYHLQMKQRLMDNHKERRVQACNIFCEIRNMDPDIAEKIIFTDEATFHCCGFVNHRNCVIWARENPREILEHERGSPKVNVWAGVTTYGIVGPYFVPGNTINANAYLDLL